MNCYNGAKYLNEAIESVIHQTYKNWELIFYDNCSTDESAKIIKKYVNKKIKYFKSKKKINLGLARHKAFEKCKGSYIAFLDCDDLWFKEKLSSQLELFKDKEVGIVISNSIIFNKKRAKRLYFKRPPEGKVFYDLIKNYYISLDTVILRKDSLKKLDKYFQSKFNIIHDLDLLTRLSFFTKLAYYPKALSKWRVHNLSDSYNKDKKINKEKKVFINEISKKFKNDKKFKIAKKKFLNELEYNKLLNLLISGKKKFLLNKLLNLQTNFKKLILIFFLIFPYGSFFLKRIYEFRKFYD